MSEAPSGESRLDTINLFIHFIKFHHNDSCPSFSKVRTPFGRTGELTRVTSRKMAAPRIIMTGHATFSACVRLWIATEALIHLHDPFLVSHLYWTVTVHTSPCG